MAFPATPTDGQVFTAGNGASYAFRAVAGSGYWIARAKTASVDQITGGTGTLTMRAVDFALGASTGLGFPIVVSLSSGSRNAISGVLPVNSSAIGHGVSGSVANAQNGNGVDGLVSGSGNGSGVAGHYTGSGAGHGVAGYANSGAGHAIAGFSAGSSGYAGYFDGVVSAASYITTSDRALKRDIRDVPAEIAKTFARRLEGVDFIKLRAEGAGEIGRQTGFIAQDVAALIAETGYGDWFVQTGPDGRMSVDYVGLLILVSAGQRLLLQDLERDIDLIKGHLGL